MALDFEEQKNQDNGSFFLRSDVRETAGISGAPIIGDFTSSQHTHSDAASGGTTTHAAGDGSDHADVLTNTSDIATINGSIVTSNVAGNGIDVSGATGDVTISAEDSTAGNKGIVIVAPGEGIDVGYSSGTATISGEDATTTNKGIASFATADFSVSSGAVSLKGVTKFWSANCTKCNFTGVWTFGTTFDTNSFALEFQSGDANIWIPVELPEGAVVTACILHGGVASGSLNWNLYREAIGGGAKSSMANAAIDTEDTTISNATIDNQNFHYFIEGVFSGSDGRVNGALITYTT